MNESTAANPNRPDVWRLRVDLHFHWVDGIGNAEGYWVVKDPLAAEWFCLTGIEKRMLELADGCRSVRELCQLAAATIKPLETSMDALVLFYAQARRKGLLVSVGKSGPVDQALRKQALNRETGGLLSGSIAGRLGKLVAFRLPGLNPNAWFQVSDATKRWATSKVTLIALGCLGLFSIALVVGKFDVIANEISLAFARKDPRWFVYLIVTVAVAKSIHELAHVVACRWVGAECRELGVMLLFGTPCLYCDVSDLWTVPRRNQRVFVSAAGMLAELCLAGLATILWAVTQASIVHDLALVVMVVCCVSTVLVNANPLLRYDGYFMLADWIGVPNFSLRAGGAMRRVARKLVWGAAGDAIIAPQVGRAIPVGALLFYAVASALYRLFVVGLITLLIYHTSVDVGLGWLGAAFGSMLLGAMILRAITPVLCPPDVMPATGVPNGESSAETATPMRQRWWNHRRGIAFVAVVILVIGLGGVIPIPRRVVVPVLVVAAEQQELHVIESGHILQLAPSGAIVEPGEVLMRLQNDRLDDQLAAADAELAVAKALVGAWESRKGTARENSAALAISIKGRDAAEKHRRLLVERVERLTLVAHSPGQLTQSIPRPVGARDQRLRTGQWMPAGTLVGWVGHPKHRNGVAVVDQNQIDLVRDGQDVRIRHASLSRNRMGGTVRQVGRAARESIPPEILAGAADATDGSAVAETETKYWVRIELDGTSGTVLPLRSVATAEISVDSTSLWNRLRRIVASEYRGL